MSCIGNFRPSTIPLKTCTKAISCPVLLLIYKRRFCIAAFREAYHPVCSIDYDHCSHLYRPTSSPSPHRGINYDQSLRANFCFEEVKRVSQQLIFSWEVEMRTSRRLVPRKKWPSLGWVRDLLTSLIWYYNGAIHAWNYCHLKYLLLLAK